MNRNRNALPCREIVEHLKRSYARGTRVELVRMNDPYTQVPTGTKGTVTCVDDAGTIFCDWDNGARLGVVYKEDYIKKA